VEGRWFHSSQFIIIAIVGVQSQMVMEWCCVGIMFMEGITTLMLLLPADVNGDDDADGS
jgi:hypothetical protein